MPRELGRVLIEVRPAAETHAVVLLMRKLPSTPGPSFFISQALVSSEWEQKWKLVAGSSLPLTFH